MLQDFHTEFELAKRSIISAGDIVLSYFEKTFSTKLKDENRVSTIVTEADLEAEAFLRKIFENEFPNYGFIGEESEEDNKKISWIVDPVDGTLAFSRGLSEFGMTVALKAGNDVIFSIMYLPYAQRLYSAYKGEGAFLNDQQIKTSTPGSLRHTLISLHQGGFKIDQYKDYCQQLLQSHTIRMAFSCVVESCNLAAGRIDALIKFDQKIWDIAPEYLLMVEAGAEVTDEFGKPINFVFSKESVQTFVAVPKSLPNEEKQRLYLSKS